MRAPHLCSIPILMMTALLAGCTTDRGYVQREWSLTLRELGIVPVFPPREDLFVGDVYAYSFDPEARTTRVVFESNWNTLTPNEQQLRLAIGMSPRLVRLDMNMASLEEYQRTPSWPTTTPEYDAILDEPELANALVAKDRAESNLTAAKKRVEEAQAEVKAAAGDADRLTKAQAALAEEQKKEKDTEAVVSAADTELERLKARRAPMLYAQPTDSTYDVFANQELRAPGQDGALPLAVSRVNRLRLVGFPEFATTTFTEGDLSSLIPIEALLLGVNLSSSNLKRVSVKVPAAESYGVSLVTVLNRIAFKNEMQDWNGAKVYEARLDDRLARLASRCADPQARSLFVGLLRRIAVRTANDQKLIPARRSDGPPPRLSSGGELGERVVRLALQAIDIALSDEGKPPADEPADVVAAYKDFRKEIILIDLDQKEVVETEVINGEQDEAAEAKLVEDRRKVAANARSFLQRPEIQKSAARTIGEVTVEVNLQLTLWWEDLGEASWYLHPAIHRAAAFQTSDTVGQGDSAYYLRVISEVYYARALDISIYSANSFGARGSLRALPETNGEPGKGEQPNTDAENGPPPSTSKPATATASDLLARTERQLGTKVNVPGGTLQLVSAAEQSIGLRRVYERPIAIGFRGITIKVRKIDGAVLAVVPPSGPPPTLRGEELEEEVR